MSSNTASKFLSKNGDFPLWQHVSVSRSQRYSYPCVNNQWQGVFRAAVTHFLEDGSVDSAAQTKHLRAMLPDTIISYAGREAAASPAVGSLKEHAKEERELLAAALEISARSAAVKSVTQLGTPAVAANPTAVSG